MAIFNSHVSLPEGKVCFDADSHNVEMVKLNILNVYDTIFAEMTIHKC